MKYLLMVALTLFSMNAFADHFANIQCKHTARSLSGEEFTVDAKGSLHSIENDEIEDYLIGFDSVVLISDHGETRSTEIINQMFTSRVHKPEPRTGYTFENREKASVLKSVSLDINGREHNAAEFVTQDGRHFKANCEFSWTDF